MKKREKRLYDYRAFSGIDASNEVSLFEYGLLWRLVDKKKQEYKFIYGTNYVELECHQTGYGKFDISFMSLEQWRELCLKSWFELDKVCEFCDSTQEEFINNFPNSMYSALQYHGAENIFGSSYYGGFKISGCFYKGRE